MNLWKLKKITGNFLLVFPSGMSNCWFLLYAQRCSCFVFWGLGVACFKPSTVSTPFAKNIASKFSENNMKSVKCIFIIFQAITDFVKKCPDQIRGAGVQLHMIQAKVTSTEKGKFILGNVAETWNQVSGRKKEASTGVLLHSRADGEEHSPARSSQRG